MFKDRHIHTLQWFLGSLLMVLLTACSSSEDGGDGVAKQPTLTIYVYSPERPAVPNRHAPLRRAETGNVETVGDESTIHSLQIWVYESENKALVGYLDTEDVTTLNMGEGATYQLPVSDDFAKNKPDVDVYVMANVTNANCGVETDKDTERDQLMTEAKIVKSKFGLSPLTTEVPTDGLPMAGKLTTQTVVGDAPALRVGTLSAVSTVQLTRAVSKLRFVFAKTTGQPTVSITSIKINENMIPDVEYLFDKPESAPTITYNTEAGELLSSPIDDINQTADPTDYIYFNQDAQEYENLINTAASKETPEVTVRGPIYLRESDKQLAGTITYTIAGDEQTADFQMQQAGDFLRNHTWIVYAYYAGSGKLQVQTVYVKDWSTKEISHNVYNW